jgi:hypothetical protein
MHVSPQARRTAAVRRATTANGQRATDSQGGAAATLIEARRAKLEHRTARTLTGVPRSDVRNRLNADDYRLPFPIDVCLCVHDSPGSPCPCNTPAWLLERPISVADAGRKNARGEGLLVFSLPSHAQILLELHCPMDIVDLDRIADWARGRGSNGSPGAAYAPPLDWLTLAGVGGYAVGTLLDDLLGSNEGGNDNLSDDVSDWAAENLPAPDWLVDVF